MPLLSDLIFEHSPGHYILVPVKLIEALEQYKQVKPATPESGGVLIGSQRGAHVEIIEATFPQDEDKKNRFQFIRRSPHHVRKTIQAWDNSTGRISYIGEWHTHPQSVAEPSTIDLREWTKKLPKRPMILIIIGTDEHWYGYWNGRFAKKL